MYLRAQVWFHLLGCFSCFSQSYVKLSAEIRIVETTWERAAKRAPSTNQWTVPFVAIVGTNEWQLDGGFCRNARERWHYDGKDMYKSLQVTSPLPTNEFHPFQPDFDSIKSNVTISVYSTVYPPGDVGVKIPWLAFCSGTFLKTQGRIVPLPVAPVEGCIDFFDYPDKTEVFQDGFGLPRRMELLASKELKERLVANLAIGPGDSPRKFHYTATESTNFHGWNFPLQFEFAEEIPRDIRGSGNYRTFHGNGSVATITVGNKPQSLFEPGLNKTVWDRRSAIKAPENP